MKPLSFSLIGIVALALFTLAADAQIQPAGQITASEAVFDNFVYAGISVSVLADAIPIVSNSQKIGSCSQKIGFTSPTQKITRTGQRQSRYRVLV